MISCLYLNIKEVMNGYVYCGYGTTSYSYEKMKTTKILKWQIEL